MPKVKCGCCAYYEFHKPELPNEPLGGCLHPDEKIMPEIYVFMYIGTNWRLNHRSSNVLRYCKGFQPKGIKVELKNNLALDLQDMATHV